mmetsp:Transcript_17584/g.43882  ORF Transcript_17584/g.43882 Transcript_17584/m.43882 type:complete len:230 (+) Transcript_17584:1411-2100(+)
MARRAGSAARRAAACSVARRASPPSWPSSRSSRLSGSSTCALPPVSMVSRCSSIASRCRPPLASPAAAEGASEACNSSHAAGQGAGWSVVATRLLARLGASAASAAAGRSVAPPLLLRLCVPSTCLLAEGEQPMLRRRGAATGAAQAAWALSAGPLLDAGPLEAPAPLASGCSMAAATSGRCESSHPIGASCTSAGPNTRQPAVVHAAAAAAGGAAASVGTTAVRPPRA